ncbi:MAG: amino acid permease, partial [Rhodospirillales bacterium]|nr:amino acid permease [Rhodospirillales bacterium]
MNLRQIVFGNPLATSALEEERLTKLRALPIFSSDALSSVAYATEEILLVLVTAGIAMVSLALPIALVICGLLAILTASYWQTIQAYPQGGGAFIVAYDNLGEMAGLIAAAALLIDYVLTVAVSVSAGVRALTSAFPGLTAYDLSVCMLAIILITIANLRGVQESAGLFSVPTYVFIGLVLLLVGVGLFKLATGSLDAPPVEQSAEAITAEIGLLFLLRAFSSGCSALTGVEAISNGVP